VFFGEKSCIFYIYIFSWGCVFYKNKKKPLKNNKPLSFSYILIKGVDLEILVFNGKPSPRVPPLGGGPYVLGMPAALGCPFWRNGGMRGSEKPSGHATCGGRCGRRDARDGDTDADTDTDTPIVLMASPSCTYALFILYLTPFRTVLMASPSCTYALSILYLTLLRLVLMPSPFCT